MSQILILSALKRSLLAARNLFDFPVYCANIIFHVCHKVKKFEVYCSNEEIESSAIWLVTVLESVQES